MVQKEYGVFQTTPLGNKNQGKRVLHSMALDITEQKRIEKELQDSEERFNLFLESSPVYVFFKDENIRSLRLSRNYEKLLGMPLEKIIGKNMDELFPSDLAKKMVQDDLEILRSGKPIEVIENFNGRTYSTTKFPVKKDGLNSFLAGFTMDITEKQKLEEVMLRAQKLESIGILAGGIAHDFNNILGGIFGYIEMALMETTEKNVSNFLTKSLNNIDRARALTQQLLTFAKGGVPIKKIDSLFPFVKKTIEFVLSGSSVTSTFQIGKNLWTCDFDKNQIGQVIDNIAINAQQAMPNGGTIEISAENISLSEKEHPSLEAGKYVKLSIKDQGIGIPKDFLSHIFDPYYTTKPKGHGLGLATCYSIIKRHNGCIDVESEPGKGSTFHVFLPASITPISLIEKELTEKHKGNGTFLVMDDEEPIRKILKVWLESFGYSVVLKENGKDAIDFFIAEFKANRKLAGMMFDLTIPGGMGGRQAIGEIREICSNTPVFAISGYSADPIMANPEKYGFNASICKPFKMEELSKMLKKHLDKK